MQKVLLSSWGGRGDVEPLFALAERLVALGAQVLVAIPPDADFIKRADELGVEVVGVGPTTKDLIRQNPPPSIPVTAAKVIAEQFDVLAKAAAGADVIVATGALPAAAGALSVAELLGIRSISVTFQQLTVPSPNRKPLAYRGHDLPEDATNRELWTFDADSINSLFREPLNEHRTTHGLAPVQDVRELVVGRTPWIATDPVLEPLDVPDYDAVQTGGWILADSTPLSTEVIEFLDAGTPPVYVGFGSMPVNEEPKLSEIVIEAVRSQQRRLVLLKGWAHLHAIDDGDDVLVIDGVNHQALFPRMAAVVHHGGSGTTHTATRSGTPQVVVPQSVDQPYWAGRAAALGVGVAHDGAIPTVASLSEALNTVLQPAFRANATSIAGRIRDDGTTVAAHLILEGARD